MNLAAARAGIYSKSKLRMSEECSAVHWQANMSKAVEFEVLTAVV
jgi:hypothetical protein